MDTSSRKYDTLEISARFRQTIAERITRLERDASADELALPLLTCPDHNRRHRRLIEVQRGEAMRMRAFLERSTIRPERGTLSRSAGSL